MFLKKNTINSEASNAFLSEAGFISSFIINRVYEKDTMNKEPAPISKKWCS